MMVEDGRVEEIRVRWRDDGTLAVLAAPPCSAITPAALAALPPPYRRPETPTFLDLAPGIRYLVGALHPRTGVYVLHRLLPDGQLAS